MTHYLLGNCLRETSITSQHATGGAVLAILRIPVYHIRVITGLKTYLLKLTRRNKMPATESPTSTPPPLRVHKRTDTAGDTAAAPMPPLPLTNDEYTPDVLKERLAYAKNVLRDPVRKLTPMGIRGLKLYERACERLLDLEEGEINELGEELSEMKDEWKWTLCTFERSMQFIACMQVTRSSDAQQLQDQLVILQRTAFYARYGDAFAAVCKTLNAHAEAKKVEGWQMLQKRYWTEIDANLQDEKSAHDRVLAGESAHGECPTYMALGNACRHVGLSRENMIRVIHLYSERNKTVHNGLIAIIKDGLYMNLAKLLYNDCCDIPLIIPAEDASLVELLQHLIETTIDLYFDRDEDQPDNFQLWTPT